MIIKAAIERFTLSGRLRVSLRPLMNQLPLIGSGAQGRQPAFERTGGGRACKPGLGTLICTLAPVALLYLALVLLLPPPACPPAAAQVSFTELPRFSFDLTLFGGDASLLPGLEACERSCCSGRQ